VVSFVTEDHGDSFWAAQQIVTITRSSRLQTAKVGTGQEIAGIFPGSRREGSGPARVAPAAAQISAGPTLTTRIPVSCRSCEH